MIAALFVELHGCYSQVPGVVAWHEGLDARIYPGPWPVVAHPPCERWGRFWFGSPQAEGTARRVKGDDGGCFAAALASVRRFGGVLEHPAGSSAWRHFGLIAPPHSGGWVVADFEGGWTCQVEQGAYGHRARKPTWLYACRVPVPSLQWGVSTPAAPVVVEHMSRRERLATPVPFRDLLLSIAAAANAGVGVANAGVGFCVECRGDVPPSRLRPCGGRCAKND